MDARIPNPALSVPGAMEALQALSKAASKTGVPPVILDLVALRASQINGCSVCVDMHWRDLRRKGESDERIFSLAAWRETPYYTDAERAVLDLTEHATRLADKSDPVPDAVWDAAGVHFDETQLSGLVLAIAAINTWNRINATSRQVAGAWVG
jgi:AhpD family alkylhydroperoxidase